MSKWPKVITAIVMVLALVVIGCAPKEAAPPEEAKTITIGILGSLTGPLRSIGEGAVCVHDYWTDLNATEGGVKYMDPQTGKEEVVAIKVLMGDHAWDMAKCVSLYERFKAGGMQFIFANGSAPTAAIYAAAARDHIPGVQVDTTCDPFIYETETEPYLSMDGPTMPVSQVMQVGWYAEEWRKAGHTEKLRLGLLAADVSTRRVYSNDEDFGFITYCKEAAGVELIGPAYMPAAPVDVKAELTQFIEEDVDILLVDHWGSGACRVLMNDAVELGMHKKGIDLNIEWLPADVPMAEPALFDEYNQHARVQASSHGWSGSESPDVVAKYPGLKKAYDLCAKYHDGQVPEERSGWYYIYGVGNSMMTYDSMKQTLEKTGYAGFSTEELRDSLFGLSPIDTGGLMPTFYPDPDILVTWGCMKITDIHNGHIITNEESPWLSVGATKVYPTMKVTFPPEWQDKIWIAPDWK
jgi:hypothetical protein